MDDGPWMGPSITPISQTRALKPYIIARTFQGQDWKPGIQAPRGFTLHHYPVRFLSACSPIPTSSDSPGAELPAASLSLGSSWGPITSLTCSVKYHPCCILPLSTPAPWSGPDSPSEHLPSCGPVNTLLHSSLTKNLAVKGFIWHPPWKWKDWWSGTWRVVCPRHSTAEPRTQVFSNRLCWVATKMALTDKNNKKRQLALVFSECHTLYSTLYR